MLKAWSDFQPRMEDQPIKEMNRHLSVRPKADRGIIEAHFKVWAPQLAVKHLEPEIEISLRMLQPGTRLR